MSARSNSDIFHRDAQPCIITSAARGVRADQGTKPMTDADPLPSPALVVGASGGIGAALVAALRARGVATRGLSRRDDGLDLADEATIAAAVAALDAQPRLVIVATGLLHAEGHTPEKSLAALDPGRLARSFAVNAIGPALLAKHLLPAMPRQGRSVFAVLSARVGSIADNGWAAGTAIAPPRRR